jgi:hypothetical protein
MLADPTKRVLSLGINSAEYKNTDKNVIIKEDDYSETP